MRVLAVGNMYPPQHLGGYELVWRSAMRHLRAAGHETRALTTDFRTSSTLPDDLDAFRELRWYWRDHGWPRLSWRGRVALERHNAAVLARHLAEFRPDVVSWWSMGGMSLALIEQVRRQQLPAVAFVHDDWLTYAPEMDQWTGPFRRFPRLALVVERFTGLPARVALDDAATFVFVSETTRRHAQAAGRRPRASSVAHSGIEPAFLQAVPERPWQWRLLYVGRIDARKGVEDAVAALAHLPETATLTLAGPGNPADVARLRTLAERLGVSRRVQELGMCSRDELRRVYAGADAVLFPVRWEEPWGLVPLEAMGLGRPVVASGRGGSGEYLRHEENCLLAEVEHPAAIGAAVRRLAAEPALRARLRANGVATAKGHTEGRFNDAVRLELERAAAGREPPRS